MPISLTSHVNWNKRLVVIDFSIAIYGIQQINDFQILTEEDLSFVQILHNFGLVIKYFTNKALVISRRQLMRKIVKHRILRIRNLKGK